MQKARSRKPPRYAASAPRTRRKVRETREPTVSTTIRLRSSLPDRLEDLAARGRRSVADVTQQLLGEGLRMQECPGIYFADEPAGRVAKVSGTGLGVWEVLLDYVRHGDAQIIPRAHTELTPAQIAAALRYYERYPDQIRRKVKSNDSIRFEDLVNSSPGRTASSAFGEGLPRREPVGGHSRHAATTGRRRDQASMPGSCWPRRASAVTSIERWREGS